MATQEGANGAAPIGGLHGIVDDARLDQRQHTILGCRTKVPFRAEGDTVSWVGWVCWEAEKRVESFLNSGANILSPI